MRNNPAAQVPTQPVCSQCGNTNQEDLQDAYSACCNEPVAYTYPTGGTS